MLLDRVGGLADRNKERLDSGGFNVWVWEIKRLQKEREDIA